MALVKFQLGKNGLTQEFIEALKKAFEKTENIRVNLLKTSTRDRKELIEIEKSILKSLGENYTSKKIGFTLALRKWRKARKKISEKE